ncbi:MAG: hypothetical protein K2W95_31930 [Candidatus Obscuribacterales bacterium]|nr:hypothetical protein [Candidatus Obscuribacterales bacterium]
MPNPKIQELELRFGVKIGTRGDKVRNPFATESVVPLMATRDPTDRELINLEGALERSAPSAEGNLRIYFLGWMPGTHLRNRRWQAAGVHWRGTVYIGPDCPGYTDLVQRQLFIHEIAHHGQYHHRLFDSNFANIVAPLGWKQVQLGKGLVVWTIEACCGHRYWFDKPADLWHRLKVSEGGLQARSQDNPHITSCDMRKRALVRPISDYLDNPVEMITEGTTAFRTGADEREKLLRKSPVLYHVVKDLDQREIRCSHRKQNRIGIRNIDGFLVQPDENVVAWIDALEMGKA